MKLTLRFTHLGWHAALALPFRRRHGCGVCAVTLVLLLVVRPATADDETRSPSQPERAVDLAEGEDTARGRARGRSDRRAGRGARDREGRWRRKAPPGDTDRKRVDRPGAEGADSEPTAPLDEERLLKLRQRWKGLPEAKRQRLRQLFARLQSLGPEERRKLFRHLRRFDRPRRCEVLKGARRHRLWRRLPAEVRDRVERLPPSQRRGEIRKFLEERRERLLATLSPEKAAEVRGLSRDEQRRWIRRYMAMQVLEGTFSDAELAGMKQLAPRRIWSLVEPGGVDRPEFLSPAAWQKWTELKPHERRRACRHLVHGERRAGHHRRRGERPPRRGRSGPPFKPSAR